MKVISVTFLTLAMLATVDALQLSQPPHASASLPPDVAKTTKQTDLASTAATAFFSTAMAASLWLGATPAMAAATVDDTTTAVQIKVNIPALLEAVQTKEARQSSAAKAQFVADVLRQNIAPYVNVEPPSNIAGFARKALRGQAGATVTPILNQNDNGAVTPVTTTVQVIGSDAGALTLQIRNPLLPKLPFVGLPQTPPLVNTIVAPLVEQAAEPTWAILQRQQQQAAKQPAKKQPVKQQSPTIAWTEPTNIVVSGRALSPLDILGGASAALGATYYFTYGFYLYEQDRQEKQAAEKKAAVVANKKQSKERPKAAVDTSTAKKKQPPTDATAEKVESKTKSTSSSNEVVESNTKTDPKVEVKAEKPKTKETATLKTPDNVLGQEAVDDSKENDKSEYPLAITIKAINDKKSSENADEDLPQAQKIKALQQIQLQRSNPEISTETVLKTKRSGGIRGLFQTLFGRKKQE
eukprot:scaffold8460_cov166-Amphora_coffeaeformis.AAC.8